MYTENDLAAVQHQIRKRCLLTAVPAVILLACAAYGIIMRTEWLTTAASIAAGCLLIFAWDLLIKPLQRYAAHIDGVLHGRTHTVDCTFECFDEETSEIDSVTYWSMHVVCLDDRQKPYDRLFYYDAALERPAWHKGDRLRVTYRGKEAGAVDLLGAA